jgi:lactate racemase
MKVELAYGDGHLSVDMPDGVTDVIVPAGRPATKSPREWLAAALTRPVAGPPLRDLVRPGQRVAISICDGTRPQPRQPVLEAILDHLSGVAGPSDVVVLVATGTHRANTRQELETMLGPDLVRRLSIVSHDARDPTQLDFLGHTNGRRGGAPIWLNREWAQADVRITTGLVEPHFFAGFSGGPKMVAPGLAGLETVLVLHDAAHIGHPLARWGVTEGNPVHEDVSAIAAATGVTFALDVVINNDHEIVAAFGGDLFAMHTAACAMVRASAMQAIEAPYDVVVTSNSGYPLDQNLYQAVKGMSAAAQIVKPGGLIVCAAECRDGFPDHGLYRELLVSHGSPAELLESIQAGPTTRPDQWQVQIQAQIQMKARVALHSSYLPAADVRKAHLEPAPDISALVKRTVAELGPGASVCVLPQGPRTVPYLAPVAAHTPV